MQKINQEELHQIFVKMQNQRKEAVEELYQAYHMLIYRIAFSILKNKEDSEEIVQMVFLKLFKVRKEKLPSTYEASWLYTLTKNETLSYIRQEKNHYSLEEVNEIENVQNEINQVMDQIEYEQIIKKLSQKEKEIVSLKVVAGCSFVEIAQLLNQSIGSVKWTYYKAMHSLKLMLGNLGMGVLALVWGIHMQTPKDTLEDVNPPEQTNQIENTFLENDRTETKKENQIENQENQDVANETRQEIPVSVPETPPKEVLLRKGLFGISGIFFFIAIIFGIFFLKHRQKRSTKSSKR